MIRRLWCDQGGQSLLEYGLVVSLLAMVALTVAAVLGRQNGASSVFAGGTAARGAT